MPDRRHFLASIAAAGLCPSASWSDVGNPAFIAASKDIAGRYKMAGLSSNGTRLFEIDLPGRGHAGAAHPLKAEAVAFARRPGSFGYVFDCFTGRIKQELHTPEGLHFYGHGTFSKDGSLLFTTENDYEAGEGRIGVWDTRADYLRVGSFSSGGVGPHEICMMPDGKCMVVANGGISTHPDTGRTRLNIATMVPNISYISLAGTVMEKASLPQRWRKNSIRHLAVRSDGLVAVGSQWQGDLYSCPSLVAIHRMGLPLESLTGPAELEREMDGYIGSISFSGDGKEIAITSPRGSIVSFFSAAGSYLGQHHLPDVCGVAAGQKGVMLTTGTGSVFHATSATLQPLAQHERAWDNHLTSLQL